MEAGDIAHLVNHLFKTYRKADGKEFSNSEVSRALDGELTPSYIAKLRRGEVKNPGRDVLKMLCLHFGVPSSYFFPELEGLKPREYDSEREQAEVLQTALRARGLSAEVRSYIEGIIAAITREKA